MKPFLLFYFLVMAVEAFALNCDCEVRVYSPLTGPQKLEPNPLRIFELEEYGSYSVRNQKLCSKSCEERFTQEMPSDRLKALLVLYAQGLIESGAVGYNCTGLTTLKFPVRVKASLGELGLGNVADVIQVIDHEQVCF